MSSPFSKAGQSSQGPVHPNAPAGGGGPGNFRTTHSLGKTGSSGGPAHPQSPAAKRQQLTQADQKQDKAARSQVTVVQDGGFFVITISDATAMRPFIRGLAEPFQDTVRRFAKRSNLDVIINGNMYDLSLSDKIKIQFGSSGPFDAGDTTPEGQVRGRGQLLGGITEPQLFYVAWWEARGYAFGFGDPPGDADSAVGGLGPILLNGLKYGVANRYRKGVPDGAAATGEPAPQHKPFLEVRSNATYKSFVDRDRNVTTGKVILAYRPGTLRIMVQPNGVKGLTLDVIRDRLASETFTNAVFLDGSDSAMLYANDQFYVRQGARKDATNTIGIGFQLPQ